MKSHMSRITKLILIGFLLSSKVVFAQQAQVMEFDLDMCIDYALKKNAQVFIADSEIEIAEKTVKENVSIGLPQVNFDLSLQDNIIVPTSFIPEIIFNPNADPSSLVPVQFSPQYSGSAGLGLSQMIFDGSFFVGLEAAKTFKELSIKEAEATRVDVIANVTKAYYATLWSKETMELAEKNYNRLDSLLQETTIMYENGFVEKIDVNRIKVQFNNIKVQRNNSKRQLSISYLLLKFQMGMPVDEHITLTERLSDLQFNVEDLEIAEYRKEDRIEYSILQTNEQLQILERRRFGSMYYPTLYLNAGYGATMGSSTFGDFTNFNNSWFENGFYGLSLRIPIFDGLKKSAQIQQSRLKLLQIEQSKVQLNNSIDLEVSQERLNLEGQIENIEAQSENMTLAEEVYDVTKIKYQQGVGSNIEVIEADASYKEAQVNYYTAVYNALVTYVNLEKALGKTIENYQNRIQK